MFATLLARLGLPLLMDVVGNALAKIDNPAAQAASKALGDTQNAITQGQITPETTLEANRHIERMTEMNQTEYQQALAEVNATIRAESGSQDAYVRRMRPTFGYLLALTWTAQMLALAYVMIFDTVQAPQVLQAVESLSTMWAVALSVLGIYVYKRSGEKKADLPVHAPVTKTVSASVTTTPSPAAAPRPRLPLNG